MQDNDFVKCPLCAGFAKLRRSELLAALNEKGLLDRLHRALDAIEQTNPSEVVDAAAGSAKPRDFARDVHTWNPGLPMWTRSPKE